LPELGNNGLDLSALHFRYHLIANFEWILHELRICESVELVNPSVRCDQVNAMSLNEFLKEHCTVQELKSTVAKQEAAILQQHHVSGCNVEHSRLRSRRVAAPA
jgi:hypothetical protein